MQQKIKFGLGDFPIIGFSLITIVLTWAILVPIIVVTHSENNVTIPVFIRILGSLPPLFAAFVMMFFSGALKPKELASKLFVFKVSWKYYLAVLIIPITITAISLNLHIMFGSKNLIVEKWYMYFPVFAVQFLYVFITEEIGFRLFLTEKLLEWQNALASAVITGVVFGLFRLPMFAMKGGVPIGLTIGDFTLGVLMWIVYAIALNIILTWVYNTSNKSIILSALLAAGFQTCLETFIVLETTSEYSTVLYWFYGLTVFLAIGIIIFTGLSLTPRGNKIETK